MSRGLWGWEAAGAVMNSGAAATQTSNARSCRRPLHLLDRRDALDDPSRRHDGARGGDVRQADLVDFASAVREMNQVRTPGTGTSSEIGRVTSIASSRRHRGFCKALTHDYGRTRDDGLTIGGRVPLTGRGRAVASPPPQRLRAGERGSRHPRSPPPPSPQPASFTRVFRAGAIHAPAGVRREARRAARVD